MEARNPEAESQTQSSEQTQPIQEIDGDCGLKMAIGPADLVVVAADGCETELGSEADTMKKKRGRPPRVQAKSPHAKMIKEEDEDVCFICFDGGSLVLCDHRGCPKAYHPACVKRDEAFFRSRAKWNCGWHICSMCQKAAHHMCYTCTYSLCKGCIKKADYVGVRGDKGFCSVCKKTIMLIENGGQEKDGKAQVDFDDKTSWEYLFKVYWLYLKGKLSLTLDELTQAKNPCKEASTTTSVIPSTCVHNGVNDQKKISPDMSPQNLESSESKRRKTDEEINIPLKETAVTKKPGADGRSSVISCKDWATKELLDFVSHMKSGDTSVLSQFDVQELMLEYIKRNNLRDPRKKSQIVCDSRLKILFGKPRVGHFEMLKLLEFHFFINEDLPKKTIKSIARQVDPDWNIDNMVTVGKDKKRRNHKKVEEHAPQNKLDEYAAIDIHNMNLIYVRRKLMENLIENSEEFNGKVVGSIVRIRISGSDQKHDMYRLVQVVGTSKAAAPYKIGNKSADVVLEVLNLDKKETMSIDKISNQDLSEDECRRLRQSIRCGLVKRFTVGEIQDKAVSLQPARLNDLMEAETLRLKNLRDRASEKGHKKSLREYVEKLQLLKTPEERERRLREFLEVHSDPKMNPDYETDDAEDYFNKEHGEQTKPKYPGISRKSSSSFKKEKDFSDNVGSRSRKDEEGSTKAMGRLNMKKDSHKSSSSGRPQSQVDYNGSTITSQDHNSASETSTSSYSMRNTSTSNDSELEKIWHYRDPSGKIQGPFCMVQLQKWSTTGYFPQDMRIWRNREDQSLLLNDVLNQQLQYKTATEKVSIQIGGLRVRTTNLSSTQHSVNREKLSDTDGSTGQSSVHNWIGSGNTYTPSFGESNESNMTDLSSPTPAGNGADIKKASSVFDIANADLMDLPSPTPKEAVHEDEKLKIALDEEAGKGQLPKTTEVKREEWPSEGGHEDEKIQNAVDKEAGKGGGAQIPKTSEVKHEWHPEGGHEDEKVQNAVDKEAGKGGSQLPETMEVKREEWHSEGGHIVTSAKMEQVTPSSSSSPPSLQPGYNYLPQWEGVRETIEFSTLAEESVSDLLAEVDAMESQNGFPSPTSRRNSFEDLFDGPFEEFSPTPEQDARAAAFNSNGAVIHLPIQATSTTAATITNDGPSQGNSSNVFDSVKSSSDIHFKWPEIPQEPIYKDKNDVNNSIKSDGQEREANASEKSHDWAGGSNERKEGELIEPTTTKSKDLRSESVHQVRTHHREAGDANLQSTKVDAVGPLPPSRLTQDRREAGDGTLQSAKVDAVVPPPPQSSQPLPQSVSLAIGSDKVHPQGNMNNFGRPALEITTRGVTIGWDVRQRTNGGDQSNHHSPGERSYKVEDLGYIMNGKPWVRQSSFGSGGNGVSYPKALPKGQRVCKFYESGRCKKGASCNYWHP